MKTALNRSKDLEIGRINLAASAAGQKALIRQYLPQVSISLSADNTLVTGGPDSRIKRLALTLSQPLYDGGRADFGRKLAVLSLQIMEKQLSRTAEELADTVRSLFLRIQAEQETCRIRLKGLALAEEQLAITRLEHDLDLGTELNLLAAEIETGSRRISAAETEISIGELLFSLKQALSLRADADVELTGSFDTAYEGKVLTVSPEELARLAKGRSLDAAVRDLDIRKAGEELTLSRRSLIPSLNIEASAFVQGNAFPLQEAGFSVRFILGIPEPLLPAETTLSAGLRGRGQMTAGGALALPLFPEVTGPVNLKASLQALKAKQTAAEMAAESLEFSIYKTIKLYEARKRQCSLSRAALDLSLKKIQVLQEQIRIGERSSLPLLQAKLDLSEQELVLVEQVKGLKDLERELEILAGLPAGGLTAFTEAGSGSTP